MTRFALFLSVLAGLAWMAPPSALAQIPNNQFSIRVVGHADYVSVGSTAVSAPTTFTVGLWFKSATPFSAGRLIGFGNNLTGNSTVFDRHIYMDSAGKVRFGIFGTTFSIATSTLSYNDGLWHQATGTYSVANGAKLYIDGTLVGSAPAALGSVGYNGYRRVGYEPINGWAGITADPSFNGQIDEAQIWTLFERSAAEIASSWASALTGAEPGLYSYLHFDEGTGTTVADASGHGNGGTLRGNAAWVATITGRVTNGASGFSGLTMAALGTPATSTSSVAIPDVSSTDSTINIPSLNPIGSVKVAVDITHSFAGDLEITLIHPDGTQVRLRNSDLNDDSENLQTTYPDLTVPVGDLSTLNGKSATGAWRLRVRDAYASDTGTLNGWSLTLGLPAVTTSATGDYSFTTLSPGSFTVAPQQAGFVYTPSSRTAAGGDTGVNFALVSAFISGQVTANGVGLSGATVTIGGFTTTTDANGNYRIDGLTPAANYTVTVSSPGFGFSQTQVTAGLGATNANFAVASYPISGRIVDSTGAGVGNVTVSAGAKSAVSASDGTYTVAQVSPGSVTVTPGKPSVTFTPANRAVTVGPAATGVNFTAAQSPPTITSIADITIAKGSSTGALRFTINDAETRAGLLQMSATSSDTTLVPVSSIAFAGVGSERTVTITPAPTLNGTALITLTVTDESGLTATTSFNLRVNVAPLVGVGRALNFNGTNAAISVPANVISFKGNYSVECWLNTTANTGARTLVAQGSGAGLFSIGTDATGQIVVSNVWNTGVAFPFGAWHHLAVVKESANTRLYLDGVLRASRGSVIPFPAQSSLFQIGTGGGNGLWQGSVDELRVWGVARTAAQIAQYQNVRVLGATPDLSGLWRFDETSATTAFDSSTNARHGTITAATRIQSPILFPRYIIPEDGPISDTLQAYDPDSAALTYTLVTPPTRGTLVITDPATGAFTYTPTLNVNGDDPFVFSVSDGFATSAASLVTITITPDTNPPTTSMITSQTVAEDTLLGPLAFTVGAIENAAANLTVTGSSSNTTLVPVANITFAGSGANRTVSILPPQDQSGTATITLTVSDGGRTTSTSFLLTVTPVNDAPTITALADQVTQPNTATTARAFTIADVDNPVSALTVTATSSNTALIPTVTLGGSGANRTVAVTPVGGTSGTSTITVQASDGSLTSTRTFQARVLVPPTIAAISNAVTSKNRGSAPIAITLADPDTVLSSLTLTATSSNPAVVSQTGFAFTGTGANRQLVVTPEPDRLGITTITVTVSDGTYTISTTFTLTVNLDPDYTFVTLPKLGGAETLVIIGSNNARSIVGTRTVGNISKPVLWDTSSSTPTISLLTGLQDGTGNAGAINERGQITGIFKPTGQANSQVFRYDNGAVTYLQVSGNGTIQAWGINESGTVVGFSSISAGNVFYYTDTTLVALNALVSPGLGFRMFVSKDGDILARNPSGHIVRVTFDANLAPSTTDLGLFGGSSATVRGINARGDFVGTKQSISAPLAYNYKTLTDFTASVLAATTAAGGPAAVLDNINNSGEIAGHGTFDGTNNAPFLLTDGKVYPTARWLPANYVQPNTFSPALINDYGDIAAVVEDNAGGQSLFMLRRQYNVGDPIAPPSGAINPLTNKAYQPPAVTALDGTDGTTTTQSYAWSDREQKLFFFRPISVEVTWITTTDLASQNPPPVVTRSLRLVWPGNPQIHVAGAPVNADPVDPASPYRAVAVKYSASTNPYDTTTKAFTATQPGYSVIHYVLAPALAPGSLVPDPSIYDNYFQVVKTVTWDDAAVPARNPPPSQRKSPTHAATLDRRRRVTPSSPRRLTMVSARPAVTIGPRKPAPSSP